MYDLLLASSVLVPGWITNNLLYVCVYTCRTTCAKGEKGKARGRMRQGIPGNPADAGTPLEVRVTHGAIRAQAQMVTPEQTIMYRLTWKKNIKKKTKKKQSGQSKQ